MGALPMTTIFAQDWAQLKNDWTASGPWDRAMLAKGFEDVFEIDAEATPQNEFGWYDYESGSWISEREAIDNYEAQLGLTEAMFGGAADEAEEAAAWERAEAQGLIARF